MDNFKLEEKWCIEVTEENSLIVGEYFKVVSPVYENWSGTGWLEGPERRNYLTSHNTKNRPVDKNSSANFSSKYPKGQILTTEQFIKYILNKEKTTTIQSEEYNNILIKLLTK